MELVNELNDRLLFAIPKKGRLHERSMELLQGIDLQFHRKPRHDICLVTNLPIALIFLPAADIPMFIGEGNVDLGITGFDMVAESGEEKNIQQVLRLGFGKCKLQVMAPIRGDFDRAEHLLGKRVVTSFPHLTSKYFNEELKQADDQDGEEGKKKTEVICLSGSVEAACSLGLADGIVDLVESGETMKAAGLKPLATILESEAMLLVNPHSLPRRSELIDRIKKRIEGVFLAQQYVLCQYNVERVNLEKTKKVTPGRVAPSISPLEGAYQDWVEVNAMVPRSTQAECMDELSKAGARDIIIFNISNCRV